MLFELFFFFSFFSTFIWLLFAGVGRICTIAYDFQRFNVFNKYEIEIRGAFQLPFTQRRVVSPSIIDGLLFLDVLNRRCSPKLLRPRFFLFETHGSVVGKEGNKSRVMLYILRAMVSQRCVFCLIETHGLFKILCMLCFFSVVHLD